MKTDKGGGLFLMMPCEPSVIVNKVRWLLAITINQRGGGENVTLITGLQLSKHPNSKN